MNILDGRLREQMDELSEENSSKDIKTELEESGKDKTNNQSDELSSEKTTNFQESREYPNSSRYPYQHDILPPVYMSAIAQSSSYSNYMPCETDSTAKYVTSSLDFQRHYQNSPPNIDKAPSFISAAAPRTSDAESQPNSTAPPSPSTTPPEDKHVWSKAEVELLLDLYETYKDQLKDPRVRKTKVWEDVARIIRERLDSDVNGCQCNQKFRNLKADFQKVLEHNGRPGNFKRVCKYYDRLANILNYQSNLSPNFHNSHPAYPTVDLRENAESARSQPHRDVYYENGHSSPTSKVSNKRKLQENMHLNGLPNGHTETYYSSKKSRTTCNCECSYELTNLRQTIERINNYVVARSAHEEERIRRIEELHREKVIAMSRFVDVFKAFIHKMA